MFRAASVLMLLVAVACAAPLIASSADCCSYVISGCAEPDSTETDCETAGCALCGLQAMMLCPDDWSAAGQTLFAATYCPAAADFLPEGFSSKIDQPPRAA